MCATWFCSVEALLRVAFLATFCLFSLLTQHSTKVLLNVERLCSVSPRFALFCFVHFRHLCDMALFCSTSRRVSALVCFVQRVCLVPLRTPAFVCTAACLRPVCGLFSWTNKAYCIWMSHIKYEWVTSRINLTCHTWTRHVTYEISTAYELVREMHGYGWEICYPASSSNVTP